MELWRRLWIILTRHCPSLWRLRSEGAGGSCIDGTAHIPGGATAGSRIANMKLVQLQEAMSRNVKQCVAETELRTERQEGVSHTKMRRGTSQAERMPRAKGTSQATRRA